MTQRLDVETTARPSLPECVTCRYKHGKRCKVWHDVDYVSRSETLRPGRRECETCGQLMRLGGCRAQQKGMA